MKTESESHFVVNHSHRQGVTVEVTTTTTISVAVTVLCSPRPGRLGVSH